MNDWKLTLRCRDCGALIDRKHTGTGCTIRKSGCCLPFMRWERPKGNAAQPDLFSSLEQP